MRFAAALVVVGLMACAAGAQPPDSWGFFGNNPKQLKFDDKTIFKEPPKTPGAPPVPPPKEIPDGGLPPQPPKIWTGGLEFGLNGSQADVNVLNIKLGSFADRKTDDNRFHYDFLYTLSTQNSVTNQNQALLNARDEILFPGTKWSLFGALQVEYDERRAYDLRNGLYAGAGYTWVDADGTLFKTRAGAGAVYEVGLKRGGPRDRWVPEALFGFDFNHKFSDRQSFVSSLDFYPSLDNFGQYRLRARAGYEIVLDPERGIVLRLGMQERYDTNPGTGPRNALNYFVTLLYKF